MNGDLGNLLTGEMGEAESRFANDDFAAAYGSRVLGRVRRRRAVRAAGVGGGTMLTAGALVVGATHMPWGALGAAPGMGGSDCVTSSPSADVVTYTVSPPSSDGRVAEMTVTDPATGGVRLRGILQSDGTWRVTDADGNPVEASPVPGGGYVVSIDGASLGIEWPDGGATAVSSDPSADGSFTYTVPAPDGAAGPSASDDCYTPSPTPSVVPSVSTEVLASVDPSPAAKPEDVTSPFQCGFVMDGLGQGSSQVAIADTTWVDPATYNATLKERWAHTADLPLELGSASIPTVRVRVDPDATARWGSGFGIGEPTDAMASSEDGAPVVESGASFVMVRDGVVVGTIDAVTQAKDQHVGFWHDAATNTQELTLVNASNAFTACPGQTLEPNTGTTFAVAGSYVKDESGVNSTDVEYSWTALEHN